MDNPGCVFCRRIKSLSGGTDQETVWKFPHSVVFLGPWQYYHGYCIVVSRRHAAELFHLDDSERRGLLDEMCLTARAINDAFQPHKLNYELLGNQVPHLHWHLFPRYLEDPDRLKPVWVSLDRVEQSPGEKQRLENRPEDREKMTQALREALRRLSEG